MNNHNNMREKASMRTWKCKGIKGSCDDNFVPAAALNLLTAATKAQVLKAPEPTSRA